MSAISNSCYYGDHTLCVTGYCECDCHAKLGRRVVSDNKEDNPDYVTIIACVNPARGVVSHMRFDKVDDGYKVHRCSDALSLRRAYEVADKWAKEKGLEIR